MPGWGTQHIRPLAEFSKIRQTTRHPHTTGPTCATNIIRGFPRHIQVLRPYIYACVRPRVCLALWVSGWVNAILQVSSGSLARQEIMGDQLAFQVLRSRPLALFYVVSAMKAPTWWHAALASLATAVNQHSGVAVRRTVQSRSAGANLGSHRIPLIPIAQKT